MATFQLLNIARSALKSRQVRTLIGERTYDAAAALTQPEGSQTGILQKIFNIGAKFVGFLVSGVFYAIAWSFSTLWEILVEAYFEIKYFDWNQTDKELQSQIDSNNQRIANAFGQLVGGGVVWLTGIAVSSALTVKFPVLAGRIALELAEEGGGEIKGLLGNLIVSTRQAVVSSLILGGLLSLRKLRLFGLAPVNQERAPWIISEKIDEKVESITDNVLRSFVQGFLDQIEESIIEMGYVVAFTLDDFYASQKAAQSEEPTRTIIITPNKDAEDEQLSLTGSQSAIEQSLQTTLATHTLVYNRDVGQIVGSHYDDWYRAKPFRRCLKLVFHDKQEPPYVVNGKASMTAELTVPDPLPGLSWEKIKRACEPFTWGPIMLTQKLDNGRKFQVNVTTVSEGKQLINRLLNLTTAKPEGIPFKTEPDQDNLAPELKIKPNLVYPAYGTLIVREPTYDGTSITYKKNKESATRFELWTTQQPENFKNLPE
jgi:hypothetical protein